MIEAMTSTTLNTCSFLMMCNLIVGGCKIIVKIISIMKDVLEFCNGRFRKKNHVVRLQWEDERRSGQFSPDLKCDEKLPFIITTSGKTMKNISIDFIMQGSMSPRLTSTVISWGRRDFSKFINNDTNVGHVEMCLEKLEKQNFRV